MTKILSFLVLFLMGNILNAQLYVDPDISAEQMVNDFFDGNCVEVSNITVNSGTNSFGYFDGYYTDLGVNGGILLTTGSVENAIGPNDQGGASFSNQGAGDMDLDLISSFGTNDATVLEFDFVPQIDFIEFLYVFGSEEYLEFVDSFNDVFAFFLSGPGFNGPYSNGAENIALLPGTDIPVTINTINDEDNNEYFICNGDPANQCNPYFPTDINSTIQYDGFTTVLSAGVNLIPGETYHIKLAVGDELDSALDSGIFLSVESLCGDNQIQVQSDFDTAMEGNTINFANKSFYGTSYSWDFGDGTFSEEKSPTHTYTENGVYEAKLIVENFCCIDTYSQIIVIGEEHFVFQSKLFLEGAYTNDGQMQTILNELIPNAQPYNVEPYNYMGTENMVIPENAVDWVLVEARTGTPNISGERGTVTVETHAALLMADGSLQGAEGLGGVIFTELNPIEPYYFCIRHRNHLDILSSSSFQALGVKTHNFASNTEQAFGNNQLKTGEDGTPVLFTGDYNQDGIIQTTDFDAWANAPAQLEAYAPIDGTLDGVVQLTDFDAWRPNKAKIGSVEIGFE